jgi:hypothetical protein
MSKGSSYYNEKRKMILNFRSKWLPIIKAGDLVSVDEVLLDAEEKFCCSTKSLMDYIERMMKVDNDIVLDGNFLGVKGK